MKPTKGPRPFNGQSINFQQPEMRVMGSWWICPKECFGAIARLHAPRLRGSWGEKVVTGLAAEHNSRVREGIGR